MSEGEESQTKQHEHSLHAEQLSRDNRGRGDPNAFEIYRPASQACVRFR